MKKKLISTLAICSMACCIGAGVSAVKANADDYSNAIVSIVPLAGASVRVDTENTYYNGIRFQATVDKAVYVDLEGTETATRTVDYGMIVAPLDYETAEGKGAFTEENLFGASRKYYIDGVTEAGAGLTKLGGGYVATLSEYEKDTTKMVLSGSLLNIANNQLTREFVGVPYICITENGVKEYHVANYKDARSMVYVAQRAINDTDSDLTADEIKHLSTNYVNYKDDTTDVASKQYTYTVEHIKLDPDGNVLQTETIVGDKTTLGTEVSVNANEYAYYTYNESLSTPSDIVYANNRTALKLYYVQDHVDVSVLDSTYGEISPEDKKYVGKSYALKEDGKYTFVVTPPAEFNKHTQQLYAFVNGSLWVANGVEGKYTVDLSGYENGSELKLSCMVDDFAPVVGAGMGTYKPFTSVEKVTESDNSVSYVYKNYTSGGAAGDHQNWGESGLFFGDAWYLGLDVSKQENKFFNKGYKYIRFDVKFSDNVTGYRIRHGQLNTGNDTFYETAMGSAAKGTVRTNNFANMTAATIKQNSWYTFYVQPTKDEIWTLWTDGGSASAPSVTYIKNIEYLEELPSKSVLHLRQTNSEPNSGVSLEMKTNGDFADSWKYTNTTASTDSNNGIFFEGIRSANVGNQTTFFDQGYQYVKMDFYVESAYSLDLRYGDSAATGWIQNLRPDTTFESDVFAIYNLAGVKVNKWTAGEWYTLVIKPTKMSDGKASWLSILTRAENTSTQQTRVMYVKNLSYEKVKPFPTTTLSVNTSKASLEMQTEGEFAGAYKYTNWSLGRGTNQSNGTGIYFDEVFTAGKGGDGQTFFADGYQYITFDFYAEASVYSLELQIGWSVDGNKWIEQLTAGKTFTSDYFSIYNQNGEKVNSWTPGQWYTVVIKPLPRTDADAWANPLNIQTNAETASSAAPVMYIKNATYSAELPVNPYKPTSLTVSLYDVGDSIYGFTYNTQSQPIEPTIFIREVGSSVWMEYEASVEEATSYSESDTPFTYYVAKAEIKLLPYTTYEYYAADKGIGVETDVTRLKTKDTTSTNFTFAHVADTQEYPTYFSDVLKSVVDDVDFLVHTGDVVEYSKYEAEWTEMLDGNFEYLSRIPVQAVSGNHETTYRNGSNETYKHFNYSIPEQASTEKGFYYSFVYGNVKFIMLNTNDLTGNKLKTEQYNWLISELKNNTATWTIVAMHNPMYSAGQYGAKPDRNYIALALQEQLQGVFAEYGVDIVLQGHDHLVSRTNPIDGNGVAQEETIETINGIDYSVDPNGVLYMMTGTSGGQTRNPYAIEESLYEYVYGSKARMWTEFSVNGNTIEVTVKYYDGTKEVEMVKWGIKKA